MLGEWLIAWAIAWVVMKGCGAVWGEYTHARGRYATDLAREHSDWSPRRVHRNARRRARARWWTEIREGFPTFRDEVKKDWLIARAELEEARAAGHRTRRELTERLEAARAARATQAGTGPEPEPGTSPEPDPAAPPAGPEPASPEPAAAAPAGTAEPPVPEPAAPGPLPAVHPDDSDWLRPGEPRCELCRGTGRNDAGTDACPACRGFGSAPPDPFAPRAAPGTICGACGRPGSPGDPVLDDVGGPVHYSHALEQLAAYRAALGQPAGPQMGDEATPPPPPPPADGGQHREDLPPGACKCGLPTCRSGWPEQDPVPAGTAPPPTPTEGTPMADLDSGDTPYEAMLAVHTAHAKEQREVAAKAQDELTAHAIVHGFNRDREYMAYLQNVIDTAEAAATAAEGCVRGMQARHADGAEYHATGQDADASAFRPA
jgi:hypothetical protein